MLVCLMMSSACMPPYERIPTNAEIEAARDAQTAFRCAACVSLGPDVAERIVEGLPRPVESVFLTAVRKNEGVLVRVQPWPFTGRHYLWLVGDLDGEPEIFWVQTEDDSSVDVNPTTFSPVLSPRSTDGVDLCHSHLCRARVQYQVDPSQTDGS